MFLCEECHKKMAQDNVCRTTESFSKSRGPCEGCRNVSNCVDCHYHHRHPMTWDYDQAIAMLTRRKKQQGSRKKIQR